MRFLYEAKVFEFRSPIFMCNISPDVFLYEGKYLRNVSCNNNPIIMEKKCRRILCSK